MTDIPCSTLCGPVPLAPSAGEIILIGGITSPVNFSFTQTSLTEAEDINSPSIELSPLSSRDFSSPSPGVLRYNGRKTKKFRASWSLAFSWQSATGGITQTAFFVAIAKDGAFVNPTAQGEILSLATGFSIYSDSSQTMLELAQGDELHLGIITLNNQTFNLGLLSMSLLVTEI